MANSTTTCSLPWYSILILYILNAKAIVISRRAPSGVPQFVLEYAPVVYLHSSDSYRPSDIGSMLINTTPKVDFKPINDAPNPLTLDNLHDLNHRGGESVYLTSLKDVATDTEQPWLKGVTPDSTGKTNAAISSAIIINEKEGGITDAFYFYFYNFNSGPPVLGIKFGDHVGDWEHIMLRFKNGVPEALWYSQHADGQAFTYGATQKHGKRPIGYSAKGSHANYATEGKHDHTIPKFPIPGGFFLVDDTDKGVLWDPTLSAYYYKLNAASNTVTPYDTSAPTNWLYFSGKWGDQQYPTSHPNQYVLFGQARFSSGPSGPLSKDLQRSNICPESVKPCWVRPFLIR